MTLSGNEGSNGGGECLSAGHRVSIRALPRVTRWCIVRIYARSTRVVRVSFGAERLFLDASRRRDNLTVAGDEHCAGRTCAFDVSGEIFD